MCLVYMYTECDVVLSWPCDLLVTLMWMFEACKVGDLLVTLMWMFEACKVGP